MTTPPHPTLPIAWIARCVWRLRMQQRDGVSVPGQARPLTYAEYVTLVGYVLAEHRED